MNRNYSALLDVISLDSQSFPVDQIRFSQIGIYGKKPFEYVCLVQSSG
jgi:hypothetical protein